MSMYIKGIEMPRLGYREIRIHPDGRITEDNEGYEESIGTAIPVPPHGRLIDADALRCLYDPHDYGLDGEQADEYDRYHVSLPVIRQNIDDMPTIIEAEDGET